jgi:4-carboxymuconolactone decarboxylase
VRYETGFTGRARELAILAVVYAWGSEFERYAHEAVGRATGLTDAEIAAIREARFADIADPYDRPVGATAWTLVTGTDLDDAAYARAHEVLVETGLFELTTLVGYYTTLALQLRVFRVAAPGRPAERSQSPGPLFPRSCSPAGLLGTDSGAGSCGCPPQKACR